MNDPLEPDHEGHLRALVEGGVEFVLIGGLAVSALGAPRATLDTDIVAAPEPANLGRLSAVLKDLDATVLGAPLELGDATSIEVLSSAPNARYDTRLGLLHVVQSPDGAPAYPELYEASLEVPLGQGLEVRVCSYEHLVAMKTASDRAQDRADLERLRDARG
ncbi:hypothetical protein BH20ACT15_BH20ACT15_00480 [soil metagenome]